MGPLLFRIRPLSGSVAILNNGFGDLGVDRVPVPDVVDGVVQSDAQLDVEVAVSLVAKELFQNLNDSGWILDLLSVHNSFFFTEGSKLAFKSCVYLKANSKP